MKNALIAIPSQLPGGLTAAVDSHFGHCGIYTLVTVANNTITKVSTLPVMPHQQGGCMAPVQYLAGQNVEILISGGMGMRPLMGFQQVGIQVYYGAGFANVQAAVEALIAGTLTVFSQNQTCGGGK